MAPQPSKGRRWREEDAVASNGRAARGSSKTGKVFILLALLLALAGVVFALVYIPEKMHDPYFLALPIREYKAPQWPVNYFAYQDADLLVKCFPAEHGKLAHESQTGVQIKNEFHELRNRDEKAVVVYLSCLARTSRGKVYLLPIDAAPDGVNQGLPLSDVLTLLRQCKTPNRLLLLDIMRPITDARLGILGDDVALTLDQQLAADKEDDVTILAACRPGQVSVVSEDHRHSVFAYYLDRGLRGHADALPYGNTDTQVSVHELAKYVEDQVNRWTKAYRGQDQRPFFWAKGKDFPLVKYPEKPSDDEPPPESPKYPEWLAKGWDLRSEWLSDGSFRKAPRAFRQLEGTVLVSEERWRGGIEEPGQLEKRLAQEIAVLKRRLPDAKSLPADPEPRSLRQVRGGKKHDGAIRKYVEPLLDQAKEKLPSTEDPKDKKPEEKKPGWLDKHKEMPFEELADNLWEAAVAAAPLTPAKVDLAYDLLLSLPKSTPYAETLVLGRLVELKKRLLDKYGQWPPGLGRQFLLTRKAMEEMQVEAWKDPHVLPWIESVVQEADTLRRKGEKTLFTEPPPWTGAETALREAERLYEDARERISVARDAREDFDRALAALPTWAAWLAVQPRMEAAEELTWKAFQKALLTWARLQETSAPSTADFGALKQAHSELATSLAALKKARDRQWDKVLDKAPSNPHAAYALWEQLFSIPLGNGALRDELWQARQFLAGKIQQKAAAAGGDFPVNLAQPPDSPERNAVRAGLAIDLFELAGLARIEQLRETREAARKQPTPARWQELADKLRKAWAEELLAKLKATETPLARADLLARLRPPLELELPDADDRVREPAILIHREKVLAFRDWLARRYREEAQAFPESPQARFYRDAARDLEN